jgi:fibro-slime domain-containing protein
MRTAALALPLTALTACAPAVDLLGTESTEGPREVSDARVDDTTTPAPDAARGLEDVALGEPAPAIDAGCGPNLTGIVRDFRDSHPDFEKFTSRAGEPGLVADRLGQGDKPVLTAGKKNLVTSRTTFDQWYRDVAGVNVAIPYRLEFVKGASGVSTFCSVAFFPIDGQGFGNEGRSHNYHLTFELHTEFVYRGGEIFQCTGDDDLWTFVNARLAIDLGGVHEAMTAKLDLDARAKELGLVKGSTYPLAVFHAERKKPGSTFRIDTTITFTNCEPIIR